MVKITGFMDYDRKVADRRAPEERLKSYKEFELPVLQEDLKTQGARCMDCGIPFCNTGCPVGNLIPDWNDHVYRGDMTAALESLESTNNFPEFTGRVCPAPCEASCVLNIDNNPVSIKLLEKNIIDIAIETVGLPPRPAARKTGKRVAIIGSGPAGMATAQQLGRAGHAVTLFERDDRIGGLLRYGIPDFKLSKSLIDSRMEQMKAEGVDFRTSVHVGVDLSVASLQSEYDAICLTGGSRAPRDLQIKNRDVNGIHFAMDFLTQQNKRNAGDTVPKEVAILATDKHVIVIGGGDTGSDCIGTSNRQGAKSVTNLEIMPRPSDERAPHAPWPLWPLLLRTSSSHEEGVNRDFAVSATAATSQDGKITDLECVRIKFENGKIENVPGTEFTLKADLVLLAMGFVHPEKPGMLEELGVELNGRGNVVVDENFMTSVSGVFAAGDMQRGQSLIVWGIADGRKAAKGIDEYLTNKVSELETPREAGIVR